MEESHPPLASRIASLVHDHFNALPARCKPTIHPDGSREWIPMSGIVVVKGQDTPSETLTCVAVTTGAKCLSASQIPRCRGLVLHDCHAEILALRAFNHWLLNECRSLLDRERQSLHVVNNDNDNDVPSSPFVRRRASGKKDIVPSNLKGPGLLWPPFELRPDIKIYMYCTCAPCGDASMELCMAAQEDPTPWTVPPRPDLKTITTTTATTASTDISPPPDTTAPSTDLLDGRAHFSLLGVVRRKPARVDAESTRSKSCSDKLALRQVTSLLSYPATLLVAPTESAYLAGLVLPEEEISRVACERAFGDGETGRMRTLRGSVWKTADSAAGAGSSSYGYVYRFLPFQVLSIPTEEVEAQWAFGKPKTAPPPPPPPPLSSSATAQPEGVQSKVPPKKSKPGTVSAVWTAPSPLSSSSSLHHGSGVQSKSKSPTTGGGLLEVIINGVKQGNRASPPTARGASALSRAKMWSLLRDIISQLSPVQLPDPATNEQPNTEKEVVGEDKGLEENDDAVRWRILEAVSYEQFKRAPEMSTDWIRLRELAMQDAKRVLQPWIPNRGDEDWGIGVLIDPGKKKA
ncbi:hypothetical protein VTN00DRAFT_2231 [Thermoascus crustaceus]|uniref:uncharacterized protein n=1 Tax=Thermoascus crustaceus TaxID=5088 RepID=UPI0037444423